MTGIEKHVHGTIFGRSLNALRIDIREELVIFFEGCDDGHCQVILPDDCMDCLAGAIVDLQNGIENLKVGKRAAWLGEAPALGRIRPIDPFRCLGYHGISHIDWNEGHAPTLRDVPNAFCVTFNIKYGHVQSFSFVSWEATRSLIACVKFLNCCVPSEPKTFSISSKAA